MWSNQFIFWIGRLKCCDRERDSTCEGFMEESYCGRGYMGTRRPNAGAVPSPLRVTGPGTGTNLTGPTPPSPLSPLPPRATHQSPESAKKRAGVSKTSTRSFSLNYSPNLSSKALGHQLTRRRDL
ncbi:hypothetical protein L3X38_024809 [Prunus dulcis]|uniref:Uncharacterized protein n=1 Tax=Prunus dulcis TaxID=3755 RepID=A0AAD4W1B5_PRUDU|nr:hypothetical protein L3X38_024809 [Prunus dulcis]